MNPKFDFYNKQSELKTHSSGIPWEAYSTSNILILYENWCVQGIHIGCGAEAGSFPV